MKTTEPGTTTDGAGNADAAGNDPAKTTDAAPANPAGKSDAPASKAATPAAKSAVKPKDAEKSDAPTEQPYPSQANLDAMRERQFGGREVTAGASGTGYQTR